MPLLCVNLGKNGSLIEKQSLWDFQAALLKWLKRVVLESILTVRTLRTKLLPRTIKNQHLCSYAAFSKSCTASCKFYKNRTMEFGCFPCCRAAVESVILTKGRFNFIPEAKKFMIYDQTYCEINIRWKKSQKLIFLVVINLQTCHQW